MTLDPWLKHHLQTQGHIHPTTGATRGAHIRTCPTCRTTVIVGYDHHTAARPCTTDPAPLTPRGEATALLAGRYTATLHQTAGRLEINRRDHWNINAHPAGHPDNCYDVVAEHQCHSNPLPSCPSVHRPPARIRVTGAPPF